MKFETINHTADVGIVAYGKTLHELFENAASGMFSMIIPPDKVKEKLLISISIDAHDLEELLITYLNELLYYYSTKKVLFKRFEILELSETHLDARVSGEKIADHEILNDIKAATYHNLKIEKLADGTYKTPIIFDV
ncbi:MAG: archease [Elusimicrobiota bacterium]